jgi:hypothetical protein
MLTGMSGKPAILLVVCMCSLLAQQQESREKLSTPALKQGVQSLKSEPTLEETERFLNSRLDNREVSTRMTYYIGGGSVPVGVYSWQATLKVEKCQATLDKVFRIRPDDSDLGRKTLLWSETHLSATFHLGNIDRKTIKPELFEIDHPRPYLWELADKVTILRFHGREKMPFVSLHKWSRGDGQTGQEREEGRIEGFYIAFSSVDGGEILPRIGAALAHAAKLCGAKEEPF